jgi:alpha-beta hydrolase superfamily lysophospholipase
MGHVMEHAEAIEGYEAVPLALPEQADLPGSGAAVLRRRSARPGRLAVMYVHCRGDEFVPDDLVGWYTDRGFHFYAADLREVGADERQPADGNQAAQDLGDCFTCLDAAAAHVRGADAIDTMIVSAHGAGAVIAALWCHARRGSRPADALVLASPCWATAPPWPEWAAAVTGRPAPVRASPLLTGARRRLRRGLDIACPVLVMCPATGWNAPGGAGGLLVPRALALRRATMRLGEHVTWLKLAGGLPGEAVANGAGRRRVFDELGRWLSAYLSGQIRDQLL